MNDELRFYGVRNREGQWFRRKGYGGGGESWVSELKKARIYNKIGPARAVASFFAEHYPSYGVPNIIIFKVAETEVLDETERFQKKKEAEERRSGVRRLKRSAERLQAVQREHEELLQEFGRN